MGDLALAITTGIGLTGYLSVQGTIAPVGEGLRLTGFAVVLYWLVEFLIIAVPLAWLAVISARSTFAEAGVGGLGRQVGYVQSQVAEEFIERLDREQFENAWHLMTTGEQSEYPTIEVYVHRKQKRPDGKGLILVGQASLDGQGRVSGKALYWTEIPNRYLPSSNLVQQSSSIPHDD
ncbi:MAG: hypothetical protein KIS91_10590 [Anaerolineae bacterium]|jgi:hypothetical protein|nr:hypothetical protein [Anaerolineae bacterium]